MNRPTKPTIEKYANLDDFVVASEKWKEDVEKYCDELEKALDKACDELEGFDYRVNMMQNPFAYDCEYKDSNTWKELMLKDE